MSDDFCEVGASFTKSSPKVPEEEAGDFIVDDTGLSVQYTHVMMDPVHSRNVR